MWLPNYVPYFKGTQNKLSFLFFPSYLKIELVTEFCKIRSQQGGYPSGTWVTGVSGCWSCSPNWAAHHHLCTFLNVSYNSIKSPSQTKQSATPTASLKTAKVTFCACTACREPLSESSRQLCHTHSTKSDSNQTLRKPTWSLNRTICGSHQLFPTFPSLACSSRVRYKRGLL